jgi:hypothetical protein
LDELEFCSLLAGRDPCLNLRKDPVEGFQRFARGVRAADSGLMSEQELGVFWQGFEDPPQDAGVVLEIQEKGKAHGS